jgi:hypothetical protein
MPRRRTSQSTKTSTDGLPQNVRGNGNQRRRPGRPPVHDEAWTKVTVVLFDRQIAFLDRLAINIRAQSGAAMSRAQLIRAVVDGIAEAEIDLTAATSEADLKVTILARLGKYRLGM